MPAKKDSIEDQVQYESLRSEQIRVLLDARTRRGVDISQTEAAAFLGLGARGRETLSAWEWADGPGPLAAWQD